MRPLMEILEDERTLLQKLEGVRRHMLKADDTELLNIIYAKKENLERDLDLVHTELKEYITELFKAGEHHE